MNITQNTVPVATRENTEDWKENFLHDLNKYINDNLTESYHPSTFLSTMNIVSAFLNRKEKPTVKPDWEIIAYMTWDGVVYKKLPSELFYPNGDMNKEGYSQSYFDRHPHQIYSVKRLIDGEIFSMGDEVMWNLSQNSQTPFTITSFEINNILPQKRMFCNGNNIDIVYIEKVKPKEPLFTTEDGVEIFDYKWVSVDENFQKWHINRKEQFNGCFPCKRFSTLEKADEYINQNKPVEVSYKDMMAYLATRYGYDGGYNNQVIKEFFQSKINP